MRSTEDPLPLFVHSPSVLMVPHMTPICSASYDTDTIQCDNKGVLGYDGYK